MPNFPPRRLSGYRLHTACLLAAGLQMLPVAASAQHAARPEALWAERQVVFWAEAHTGAVHAVGIRNGVSEFGVLRAPQRRAVTRLSLDPAQAVLTVTGDDAVYHYDARTLHLIRRDEARLARAPQAAGGGRKSP
ncbi:hypothetical protein OPU71_15720 [Niveibacterium sp. 24ML]|uniref:hypothetical protein n=1 Tax=Niveibacterium sp. 24ML TaxID=2985512 RepID=UPI00227206F1|nr:hypothetical protein [Niveibacterium sp. 24ML]MCX9157575.1 hypothetical protein [Niveibacterium sp. 24ML]